MYIYILHQGQLRMELFFLNYDRIKILLYPERQSRTIVFCSGVGCPSCGHFPVTLSVLRHPMAIVNPKTEAIGFTLARFGDKINIGDIDYPIDYIQHIQNCRF